MTLLSRRDLSEAQLRERLARRGFEPPEVVEAVETVKRYGYLNDARLAEGIADKARRTGRGRLWVERALLRRGLSSDTIDAACAATAVPNPRDVIAQVEKRFGPLPLLERADRERAFRYLVGRGYEPEWVADLLGADEGNGL